MLMLERRLSAKVRMADGIVGGTSRSAFVALGTDSREGVSPVKSAEALRAYLLQWLDPLTRRECAGIVIASAASSSAGWLGAVRIDELPRFVYSIDGAIGEDPGVFAKLAKRLGRARPVQTEKASTAMGQVQHWVASRQLGADLGVTSAYPTAKRAVLDRLSQTIARAPRHRRTTVLAAAQRARDQVSAVAGVGAERILAELARSVAEDEAWIHSVEAFGALHSRGREIPGSGQHALAIDALILFSPDDDGAV